MVYVWLNSPELSRERVLARVAKGGHDVPEAVIQRRYSRSQNNLINYLNICDMVYVFDNSGEEPEYVGHGSVNGFATTLDHDLGYFIHSRLNEA